ncbi:hypothetical protein VTH82DRAFT_478 [Thermothelomyces myriococcoides]
MDFAKGLAKTVHELSTTATTTDQIVINGAERNEMRAARSGLPAFFRTAVLLERRPGDTARFTATFTIRAEIDDLTDALIRFKRFVGLVPRDDPIIFDPTINEEGRLSRFKNMLDKAPLMDECKFVVFKSEPGSSGQEGGKPAPDDAEKDGC